MNQSLIDAAREAGCFKALREDDYSLIGNMAIERFTAIIRRQERERCAKVCDDMVLYTGIDCAAEIRAMEDE